MITPPVGTNPWVIKAVTQAPVRPIIAGALPYVLLCRDDVDDRDCRLCGDEGPHAAHRVAFTRPMTCSRNPGF